MRDRWSVTGWASVTDWVSGGDAARNCRVGPDTGRLLTTTGLRVREVTATNGRPAANRTSASRHRETVGKSHGKTLGLSERLLPVTAASEPAGLNAD